MYQEDVSQNQGYRWLIYRQDISIIQTSYIKWNNKINQTYTTYKFEILHNMRLEHVIMSRSYKIHVIGYEIRLYFLHVSCALFRNMEFKILKCVQF